MFESTLYAGPERFTMIPGLQNVTDLTLGHCFVEWAWFKLPQLKPMSFGSSASVFTQSYTDEKSDIISMTWNLDSYKLSAGGISFRMSYKELLKHLRSLCNLSINVPLLEKKPFSLSTSTIQGYCRPQHWLCAIRHLIPAHGAVQKLETLTLGDSYRGHDSITKYIPLGSIAWLGHLRVLDKQQCALLGSSYAGESTDLTFLPSSLEKLSIWHPTLHIITWLDNLYDAQPKTLFPNLTSITLHCYDWHDYFCHMANDGAFLENIAATMSTHPVWSNLSNCGIEVLPVKEHEKFDENWRDAEYDPLTASATRFFHAIKADAKYTSDSDELVRSYLCNDWDLDAD
jgi:hypothetical protein